jgi:hypothetical protein
MCRYDNAGGKCSNSTTVQVGNSGEWKSVNFTVTDAVFARSCGPAKADVVISQVSTSGKDVILHGLEVYRTN